LAPSNGELRMMVQRLQDRFGEKTTADLLGVSALTLRDWTTGRWRPCAASPKCIWLVYNLIFCPEKLGTLLNVATWGRFAVVREAAASALDDWSI
jgi:hypothetical protein